MRTLLSILLLTALATMSCGHVKVINPEPFGLVPVTFPDYRDVTIPATIAPLNFSIDGATCLDVTLTGDDGTVLHVNGPVAQFPPKAWKRMLAANKGASIQIDTYGLVNGRWREYAPFWYFVSEDDIDYGLAYRLILPSYEGMGKLGIYERELSTCRQREIISTEEVNGCMNCHAFNQCDPSDMNLHVRGANGATLIQQEGELKAWTTKTDSTISSCVYPYWHPSGNYIAYSTNTTRQGFYQRPENVLEVFDYASDIVVCDLRTGELFSCPLLKGDDAWETFPAFSPDGRTLYFCRALPKEIPGQLSEIRYDLCSIVFDPESGTFGDHIDTLIPAADASFSISFPRPSFDGRFLMFTTSVFGNFTIWHNDADLCLLDLETGEIRSLDSANSPYSADSYHNWSSNSRWFVFGSRREDLTHTRAYICHIDENGVPSKPFLLPQKNPRAYYDALLMSYNIPEFITAPVSLDSHKAWSLLKRGKKQSLQYRTLPTTHDQ